MTFGRRLQTLRLQKKVTQLEAADGIGIAVGSLNTYEHDGASPKLVIAQLIANYYQVSLDYLASGRGSK